MSLALRRGRALDGNPGGPVDFGMEWRLARVGGEELYVDSAEAIAALLDAAENKQTRAVNRRAILTVLCFAGLRLGELCSLRWRDVDLAAGWLTVGESRTDAGVRRVKVRGIVHDELAKIKPCDADPEPRDGARAVCAGDATLGC